MAKYKPLIPLCQDDLSPCLVKFRDGLYKIEECGNTTFLTTTHYGQQYVEILPDREYVVLRTGEVLKMKPPAETRGENLRTLKNSLARLSKLIDANFERYKSTLTFTLTYKDNMTDTKELYQDWKKFWQRFQYQLGEDVATDYIVAFEPQGRGAWHAHACVFQKKKRFLRSQTLEEIWGLGFVKIGKRPKNLDSLGKYLTAYLSDVPLSEYAQFVKDLSNEQRLDLMKQKFQIKGEGDREHQFVKGARMLLYPARFRFFRWSKGIEQPKEKKMILGGQKVLDDYGKCVSAKEYCVNIEGKDEPLICKSFVFKKKVNEKFRPLAVVEYV